MTEQEAINVFKGFKFTPREMKAVEMSIEALEKQIPEKPKIVEADMEGMDMETGEEYTYKIDEAHCIHCDHIVGLEFDRFDKYFCSNCGQKIDWSIWV